MNNPQKLATMALIIFSTTACAQVPTTPPSPPAKGVSYRDTAHVTDIKILTQRFNQPQQVCNQVPGAPAQSKQQASHGYGGALIGGVAGGLIGHTVGEGNGKDAATAGAAVIGALVGDHLQNQAAAAPAAAPTPTMVTQCNYVDNWVERQSGAIVTYTWLGHSYSETLSYVPAYRVGDDVQLQVSAVLGGRA